MAATFTLISDRSRAVDMERVQKVLTGILVISGSIGASEGDIPASVFGLTYIEESGPLVDEDNSAIILTSPSYAGTSLLGRTANADTPADITASSYRITVKGY